MSLNYPELAIPCSLVLNSDVLSLWLLWDYMTLCARLIDGQQHVNDYKNSSLSHLLDNPIQFADVSGFCKSVRVQS